MAAVAVVDLDGDGGLPKTIQIIAQKSGATQRAAPAPYTKMAADMIYYTPLAAGVAQWLTAPDL